MTSQKIETDRLESAISFLDRACNRIMNNRPSGMEFEFVRDAREIIKAAEKQLRAVRKELGRRYYPPSPPEAYHEEPTACYCMATSHPPCSFCTNQTREEASEELPDRWQDRLIFDYNVSATSPVIKGTWITVAQIISLIVDGWSWSDILRTHPEAHEEDIRTALAYTVEKDEDIT